MRIIAGSKRGLKLLSPKTNISRPITDRVKESVFSVIYKYDMPEGKVVADVFSGVGSMGLEALSRGAEVVIFVERNPKIIDTLRKNIDRAGFADKSRVVRGDAFKIGAAIDFDVCKAYDLVTVDPPFAALRSTGSGSQIDKLMNLLVSQLNPGGIVVVRMHKAVELFESYGNMKKIDRRKWGLNAVEIFQLYESISDCTTTEKSDSIPCDNNGIPGHSNQDRPGD